MPSKACLRAATALAGAALLVACGGGGGVSPTPPPPINQTPTPVPTPTPTPVPTPTPSAVNYNTAEYNRSNAATQMNAIAAYNRGATGDGVTVAVLDSGIDIENPEFAGRIHPASQDATGNGRTIDDSDGHGTSVSAVALAGKNDSGIHGVSFASSLLALRTDAPGTCTGDDDGCSHNDSSLARAIDVAVSSGAKVINMSLGGSAANSQLRNAIARAATAGAIVVISAGNDGGPDPDPLALVANDPLARNQVIIAGSIGTVGNPNAISTFSNRAGSGASHYVAAPGYRVRSFDEVGDPFLYSGTSYAAPSVSGAVALLFSAFPNLTAAQVVEILFTSANDAGAPGTDSEFGRGIVNLTKAFQPIGGTSLAGSAVPVTGDNATLGGALGDGVKLGSALQGAVILDGFDRAFAVDLAATLNAAPVQRPLAGRLADRSRGVSIGNDSRHLFINLAPATSTRPWVGLAQIGVDANAADQVRARYGLIASKLGASSRMGIAVGYGAETLLGSMTGGNPDGAFITGANPLVETGFARRDGRSAAVTRQVGNWSLGLAVGRASTDDPRRTAFEARREGRVDTVAVEAGRRVGPLDLKFGLSQMRESDSVLGSWTGPALGFEGAVTRFASVQARLPLGAGFTLGAGARHGWTDAKLGQGLITSADGIRSLGFQFDLAKTGVFGGNDRLDFRIAQALRVSGGRAQLSVPVGYDYATLATTFDSRSTNLTPSGREIDVEAAYSLALFGGEFGAHLYWRNDPGHVAALGDDVGAALRFSFGF